MRLRVIVACFAITNGAADQYHATLIFARPIASAVLYEIA